MTIAAALAALDKLYRGEDIRVLDKDSGVRFSIRQKSNGGPPCGYGVIPAGKKRVARGYRIMSDGAVLAHET